MKIFDESGQYFPFTHPLGMIMVISVIGFAFILFNEPYTYHNDTTVIVIVNITRILSWCIVYISFRAIENGFLTDKRKFMRFQHWFSLVYNFDTNVSVDSIRHSNLHYRHIKRRRTSTLFDF